MSQRRMPSGQGPARAGGRATSSARPGGPGNRSLRRVAPGSVAHGSAAQGSAAQKSRAGGRRVIGEPSSRTDQSAVRTGVRRAVGPARRIKAPQRPRRLSGRAAALGLLLLALTLAYAYPLRVYLAQQAEIDQLEASQQAQRAHIQQLAEQVAAWNDDEYVVAQARSRLQLVRAGERLYVVVTDPAPADDATPSPSQPWYSQLWGTLETADDPPVAP